MPGLTVSTTSATALAAALLLAAPAVASEVSEEPDRAGLYRPADTPRPPAAAARVLVEQLLGQVREGVDGAWLDASFRPARLPTRPPPAWYARLGESLREGALGRQLAASDGVVTTFEGPDYVRVLLGGDPLLGVVVRTSASGLPVIDHIEPTICTLCDEPTRFVRDLIAEVGRTRRADHRLLPGVELYVAGWLEESGVVPHHWLDALQARNHQGGHLAWLLVGAEVVEVEGRTVTVAYADGREDTWVLRYDGAAWQVDYGALPADSPLRLSPEEARAWRSQDRRERAALHGWSPSWLQTHDEAGLQIGDRAIGAAFDPRDGTVLVGVLDLDRVLAGVFRVDVEGRRVLERWSTPTPRDTTPIPVEAWFPRWHLAASPDARQVAVTAPDRVWRLDTASGRTHLVTRAQDVTALGWTGDPTRPASLWIGEARGDVHLLQEGLLARRSLTHAPLELAAFGPEWLAVTRDGAVRSVGVEGDPVRLAAPCETGAVDAALHPERTEILVACAPGSTWLAARVPLPEGPTVPVEGVGSEQAAASWSPDGRWFTTGAAGEAGPVLLWSARQEHPVASLGVGPVRQVAWSPDSTHLVTVGTDGTVWAWDLHAVRQQRGLRTEPAQGVGR